VDAEGQVAQGAGQAVQTPFRSYCPLRQVPGGLMQTPLMQMNLPWQKSTQLTMTLQNSAKFPGQVKTPPKVALV
jgi:hypothetical protein